MRTMSETQTSHEPGPDELAHATDNDAHLAEAIGPVDVQAWGALVLGVAAGLLIVLCLVLTTSVLA